MAHWTDEFKDFKLSKDGSQYSAIGEEKKLLNINAIDVIKILDYIAVDENNGNNGIKSLRIEYCRIEDDLNIYDTDPKKAERVKERDIIKLPDIKLSFQHTVFDGNVQFRSAQFEGETLFSFARFEGGITNFSFARFEGITDFCSAKFEGLTDFNAAKFGKSTPFSSVRFEGITNFSFAMFGERTGFRFAKFKGEKIDFCSAHFKFPASFQNVKYWSDSVKTTWARKFWRNGKLLKYILPKNSPPGKPKEPAQFHIDSNNVDESSNATFKRYVADQQFMREFKENHPFWYHVWRWSSDCGRSIGLWAFWSLLIAFLFALVYFPSPAWLPGWWCNFWQEHGAAFQQMADKYEDEPLSFWSSFYFSIVTFTTLGFGDVVANNPFARFLVTFEVILGYVMLGGLISIFANKLARRS